MSLKNDWMVIWSFYVVHNRIMSFISPAFRLTILYPEKFTLLNCLDSMFSAPAQKSTSLF